MRILTLDTMRHVAHHIARVCAPTKTFRIKCSVVYSVCPWLGFSCAAFSVAVSCFLPSSPSFLYMALLGI